MPGERVARLTITVTSIEDALARTRALLPFGLEIDA
jgi:hypothetical protein